MRTQVVSDMERHRRQLEPSVRPKSPFGALSEDSMVMHLSGDDMDIGIDLGDANDHAEGLRLGVFPASASLRRKHPHRRSEVDSTTTNERSSQSMGMDRSSHSMGMDSNAGVFGDDDSDEEFASTGQTLAAAFSPSRSTSLRDEASYKGNPIRRGMLGSSFRHNSYRNIKTFSFVDDAAATKKPNHASPPSAMSPSQYKPPTKSASMVPQYSGSDNDDNDNDNDNNEPRKQPPRGRTRSIVHRAEPHNSSKSSDDEEGSMLVLPILTRMRQAPTKATSIDVSTYSQGDPLEQLNAAMAAVRAKQPTSMPVPKSESMDPQYSDSDEDEHIMRLVPASAATMHKPPTKLTSIIALRAGSDQDDHAENLNKSSILRKPPKKTMSMEPQCSDSDEAEADDQGLRWTVATTSMLYESPKKSTSMEPHYASSDDKCDNRNSPAQDANVKDDEDIHGGDRLDIPAEPTNSNLDFSTALSAKPSTVPQLIVSNARKRFSTRRKTSYDSVVTAAVTSKGVVPRRESGTHLESPLEDMTGPAFRQFALLSLPHEMLLRRLHDDRMLQDDGPRNLDAFLINDVEYVDRHPEEDRIGPHALSAFCFPDGLRVRFLPKAGMEGAERVGMVGPNGDCCHILVFTNGAGEADHGVAITIKSEFVLAKGERMKLSKAIVERRTRRLAATKIARWFKSKIKDRILSEALQISGFEDLYIEELRAQLTASEVKILAKSLRQIRPHDETPPGRKSTLETSKSPTRDLRKKHGIQKKLRKMLGRKEKDKSMNEGSPKRSAAETSEVASVTRNAMLRSASSAYVQAGVYRTESEDSGDLDDLKTPLNRGRRMFRSSERISSRTSMKSLQSALSSRRGMANTTMASTPKGGKLLSSSAIQWAKSKAKESYDFMKENAKLGFVCVVEKCYTLIGCQPDEYALLLGPLQQLINSERSEIFELRTSFNETNCVLKPNRAEQERELERVQTSRRHSIIASMLRQLCLTTREALVSFPTSELLHVSRKQQYFRASIPNFTKTNGIKLPLPLPRVGNQWGLAKLLQDIGPDSLILVLKLLLLERSILVLGDDLQDVTACACALLELLKPFEWASTFMPVLSHKMIDFLNSPVPFVAGMAVKDAPRVLEVESDERTLDAMAQGMSLLNLTTNTLHITSEKGMSGMMSLDPYLREQLQFLTNRVQLFCCDNPKSGLTNFQTFIRDGLEPHESLTLHAVCLAIERHFSRFCSDLATSGSAWKKYGTMDGDNFTFKPEWFLNPIRADLAFHEAIVETQLFLGYVDDRRLDEMDAKKMKTGDLGKFIAFWIYRRWVLRKQRKLRHSELHV